MKHLCVFLAYQNFEHISLSFNSMYLDNIDYFIIENYSINSELIKDFFIKKKVKNYIQFEENIAANAVNIFIRDFYNLMQQYDIITITDGDLYLYDAKSAFNEIVQNLNYPNAIISSMSLFKENDYKSPNPIVGIENYIEKCKNINIAPGPDIGHTANNLVTLKKENLFMLKNIYYLDSNLKRKVQSLSKAWVRTSKNKAYHLTWDLYREGNEYYDFKLKNLKQIWSINKECKYKKII